MEAETVIEGSTITVYTPPGRKFIMIQRTQLSGTYESHTYVLLRPTQWDWVCSVLGSPPPAPQVSELVRVLHVMAEQWRYYNSPDEYHTLQAIVGEFDKIWPGFEDRFNELTT